MLYLAVSLFLQAASSAASWGEVRPVKRTNYASQALGDMRDDWETKGKMLFCHEIIPTTATSEETSANPVDEILDEDLGTTCPPITLELIVTPEEEATTPVTTAETTEMEGSTTTQCSEELVGEEQKQAELHKWRKYEKHKHSNPGRTRISFRPTSQRKNITVHRSKEKIQSLPVKKRHGRDKTQTNKNVDQIKNKTLRKKREAKIPEGGNVTLQSEPLKRLFSFLMENMFEGRKMKRDSEGRMDKSSSAFATDGFWETPLTRIIETGIDDVKVQYARPPISNLNLLNQSYSNDDQNEQDSNFKESLVEGKQFSGPLFKDNYRKKGINVKPDSSLNKSSQWTDKNKRVYSSNLCRESDLKWGKLVGKVRPILETANEDINLDKIPVTLCKKLKNVVAADTTNNITNKITNMPSGDNENQLNIDRIENKNNFVDFEEYQKYLGSKLNENNSIELTSETSWFKLDSTKDSSQESFTTIPPELQNHRKGGHKANFGTVNSRNCDSNNQVLKDRTFIPERSMTNDRAMKKHSGHWESYKPRKSQLGYQNVGRSDLALKCQGENPRSRWYKCNEKHFSHQPLPSIDGMTENGKKELLDGFDWKTPGQLSPVSRNCQLEWTARRKSQLDPEWNFELNGSVKYPTSRHNFISELDPKSVISDTKSTDQKYTYEDPQETCLNYDYKMILDQNLKKSQTKTQWGTPQGKQFSGYNGENINSKEKCQKLVNDLDILYTPHEGIERNPQLQDYQPSRENDNSLIEMAALPVPQEHKDLLATEPDFIFPAYLFSNGNQNIQNNENSKTESDYLPSPKRQDRMQQSLIQKTIKDSNDLLINEGIINSVSSSLEKAGFLNENPLFNNQLVEKCEQDLPPRLVKDNFQVHESWHLKDPNEIMKNTNLNSYKTNQGDENLKESFNLKTLPDPVNACISNSNGEWGTPTGSFSNNRKDNDKLTPLCLNSKIDNLNNKDQRNNEINQNFDYSDQTSILNANNLQLETCDSRLPRQRFTDKNDRWLIIKSNSEVPFNCTVPRDTLACQPEEINSGGGNSVCSLVQTTNEKLNIPEEADGNQVNRNFEEGLGQVTFPQWKVGSIFTPNEIKSQENTANYVSNSLTSGCQLCCDHNILDREINSQSVKSSSKRQLNHEIFSNLTSQQPNKTVSITHDEQVTSNPTLVKPSRLHSYSEISKLTSHPLRCHGLKKIKKGKNKQQCIQVIEVTSVKTMLVGVNNSDNTEKERAINSSSAEAGEKSSLASNVNSTEVNRSTLIEKDNKTDTDMESKNMKTRKISNEDLMTEDEEDNEDEPNKSNNKGDNNDNVQEDKVLHHKNVTNLCSNTKSCNKSLEPKRRLKASSKKEELKTISKTKKSRKSVPPINITIAMKNLFNRINPAEVTVSNYSSIDLDGNLRFSIQLKDRQTPI